MNQQTTSSFRPRPARRRMDRLRRLARAFRRCSRGLSAVEFALVAPMLFFALVATADVGLALFERMTIDHVLRAGAQSAMTDQGSEAVKEVLTATASRNFPDPGGGTTLKVDAPRYCACPERPSFEDAVACSAPCDGGAPTFIFYRLSGEKAYDGMILPSMTLAPTLEVQVR